MRKFTSIIFFAIISISCQSEKEKKLNAKSSFTFNTSDAKIEKSEYLINLDSFKVVYEKCKSENPQTGLDFANRFAIYADKLLKKKEEIDLAENILTTQRNKLEIEQENADIKVWENSKYGKLLKKQPDWTVQECMNVIEKKYGLERHIRC